MNLWFIFWSAIYDKLWSLWKWTAHKCTGNCEIQRLCCSSNNTGAERSKAIEYSIVKSKSQVLKKMNAELSRLADSQLLTNKWILFEKYIDETVVLKEIDTKTHVDFIPAYRICLVHIYGYKQLIRQIHNMRSIICDPRNSAHQKMLQNLWSQLMDEPLSGVHSKQWQDIGFQGPDPSLDLRSMGLLALDNLLFFVTVYREMARNTLQHSLHPTQGYPFAWVGINLTQLVLKLLLDGHLKTHFYNCFQRIFKIEDFHKVYSYLYTKFDKLWIDKTQESEQNFYYIISQFESQLTEQLADDKTVLSWEASQSRPVVETKLW
ncbi:ELMO domain-containing protein 2-like [Oppia nitens]|uniref:ELMO domain-containing protein 2-like n=1 Tax=Oppia nitens TaxID=1686743 RepID=UPI0023DAB0EB|nr:ELMO domain-containing protein 2-like [Oppia nitens]